MTLVEVLASVVIATAVMLGAASLWTSVTRLYQTTGANATQISDTSFAYWQLERLSQNALSIGTQAVDSTGAYYFVRGQTNGPVSVLAMHVSSVDSIVPKNSVVYNAVNNGSDYICIAVVPYQGRNVLGIFPGGDAYDPTAQPAVYPPTSDVTPIFSVGTDFSGTQFSVLDNKTFSLSLQRTVKRVGTYTVPASVQSNLATITYQFMIGSYTY